MKKFFLFVDNDNIHANICYNITFDESNYNYLHYNFNIISYKYDIKLSAFYYSLIKQKKAHE